VGGGECGNDRRHASEGNRTIGEASRSFEKPVSSDVMRIACSNFRGRQARASPFCSPVSYLESTPKRIKTRSIHEEFAGSYTNPYVPN